ncbi:MAG: hypothetical protein IKJ69_04045 [Clostridia bacterium]|nr:hypothetical protein [Clostridia bacterium]
MSLFKKGNDAAPMTQKAIFEKRYKNSIVNILLVLGFTAVNVVLLLFNADTYFLFSAFLPYLAVDYGMYFCGLYPAEYYYGDEIFMEKTFLYFMIAVAVIILALYLVCWIFARKKKVGWLIFALVFFAIDTASMFYFIEIGADSVTDIVFHGWVLVSMAIGVHAYYKMKKLPDEEPVPEMLAETDGEEADMPMNSVVLRMADESEKYRTLIAADHNSNHIEVRRVKRTNELVINGMVYDEYEALAESAHTLSAVVGGQKIEGIFDGISNMFIFVDGQEIAKKIRII